MIAAQIQQRLDSLPKHERELVLKWLDHQLMLLSLMPEQQRYDEYAQAELAKMHYALLAKECELARPNSEEIRVGAARAQLQVAE